MYNIFSFINFYLQYSKIPLFRVSLKRATALTELPKKKMFPFWPKNIRANNFWKFKIFQKMKFFIFYTLILFYIFSHLAIRLECSWELEKKLEKEAFRKSDWKFWRTKSYRKSKTYYTEGWCVLDCRSVGRC